MTAIMQVDECYLRRGAEALTRQADSLLWLQSEKCRDYRREYERNRKRALNPNPRPPGRPRLTPEERRARLVSVLAGLDAAEIRGENVRPTVRRRLQLAIAALDGTTSS